MSGGKNIAVFIRHGDYQQRRDTPSALQPFPLSTLGEQQAASVPAMLVEFCQAHNLQVSSCIHSSCLLRAWQTAAIIGKALAQSLAPTTIPLMASPLPSIWDSTIPSNFSHPSRQMHVQESQALCERAMGSLANLSVSAIEDVLRKDPRYPSPPENWKSDSHYALPYPGAESLMQAGQRVANHIQQVMAALPKDAGVLQIFVGHGAAFRHAACHKGMLSFEDIARLSMFHAKPIYFTVKKSHWEQQAGDWKIRTPSAPYTD